MFLLFLAVFSSSLKCHLTSKWQNPLDFMGLITRSCTVCIRHVYDLQQGTLISRADKCKWKKNWPWISGSTLGPSWFLKQIPCWSSSKLSIIYHRPKIHYSTFIQKGLNFTDFSRFIFLFHLTFTVWLAKWWHEKQWKENVWRRMDRRVGLLSLTQV